MMALWNQAVDRLGARGGSRPPSIVVVDDDRDTRELYRACFDMSGFVTAEAATGTEGIAAAQRLIPDVVLTDLILPDIDGFEIAQRLKADALTSGICVVLLTGYGINDLEKKAAAAGITRALLKPCLPQAMLREVRRALKQFPALPQA